MTNPPFGTKKRGGRPQRSDVSVTAETSNKQLAFVEHVVRALKPGGPAAIVVPDNVLFEDNVGRRLRQWTMELCDLHTILRLPTGIFYAQGVKTNVLFFSRGATDRAKTKPASRIRFSRLMRIQAITRQVNSITQEVSAWRANRHSNLAEATCERLTDSAIDC